MTHKFRVVGRRPRWCAFPDTSRVSREGPEECRVCCRSRKSNRSEHLAKVAFLMPPTLGGYSKPVRGPSSFSCCRRRLKFLGANNSSSERWNELEWRARSPANIKQSRAERGYDYCCLALFVGCRDQQRDRAHVSRGFAATARSDRTGRSDCLGGQSRRQVEAGHFLSAVPAAIALSGRLAHSEGGSVPRQGTIWNWRSASSCSRSSVSDISSTG